MRLSFIGIISLIFFTSVNAEMSFAQQVTYKKQNVSLKELFDEITRQTGYYILYQSSKLEDTQKMNIDFEHASLDEVLDEVLAYQNHAYTIKSKTIIIKPKNGDLLNGEIQPITIQGQVTDTLGNPLSSVTVKVKNSPNTTITDRSGRYSIAIRRASAVLVFSFIGYETLEIESDRRTIINAVLKADVSEISDVVVTGLYSRPTENFTGSATTIDGDQLREVNAMSVFDALKVFDPALHVPDNMEFGSDPNRLPELSLRGTNNFPVQGQDVAVPASGADFMAAYRSNPSMPLFMLDGFEVSLQKIYDLDITRIDKITILKDAVATSAYGARASNGVIVVETKQPQAGKLAITYTTTIKLTAPDLSSYNLLNAYDKLELERLGGLYNTDRPENQLILDRRYSHRRAEVERGVDTYWLAQPLQTAVGNKQALYVEGGDEFVRYGVNFGYTNNTGVMKESQRKTYEGGMMLSYRKNHFLVRNQLNINANKSTNSPYGSFADYSRLNPYWNPFDANGNVKKTLETIINGGISGPTIVGNPLYNATLGTMNQSAYSGINNNTFLEWRLDNGIRVTGKLGLTSQKDEGAIFLPADHTAFANITDYNSDEYASRGSYNKRNSSFFSYDASLIGNYNKSFGKNLIYATLGVSAAEQLSKSSATIVRGFPNNRLNEMFFGKEYLKNSRPTGQDNINRRISSFASFNYTFDKRLLFDLALNVDGSTQFGELNRFAPFWAVGLGWNLHKEDFMQAALPVINRFKIRAGLGTTGSQQFSPFMAVNTYQYNTTQDYLGMYGATLLSYGNTSLKWQQTMKQNLGIDMSLFEDRIMLRMDVYRETTNNLLLDVNTPPSVGVSSYKENMGKLRNIGVEGNLTAFLYRPNHNGFTWSFFVNGIYNKNEIKEISNSLKKMNEKNDLLENGLQTKPQARFVEGQSVNAIWAVRSAGIDPSTGREVFYDRNGRLTYEWRASDKVVVGDELPDLRGNLGTNITYKGFQLGAYFSYELGGKQYNQTLADYVENADIAYNVDKRVLLDRWRAPGDETYFKGLTDLNGEPVTSPTYATTRFLQTNNYLNFTSISLGYILPDHLLSKLKLKNTRITVQANDILQLSTIQIERGLSYPFARNFMFSLSTSF